jgi:hypothetical protein
MPFADLRGRLCPCRFGAYRGHRAHRILGHGDGVTRKDRDARKAIEHRIKHLGGLIGGEINPQIVDRDPVA